MQIVNWDAALNEALMSLCTGGEILSYREIAQRLSRLCGYHVTKNMVIGKARRLGVPSRPMGKRGGAELHRRNNIINLERIRRVAAPIQLPEEVPMEPHCMRTFDQLRLEHECHFPYGDRHPVMFCGDPKLDDGPYCQYHHEVAHRQGRIPYADYRDKQTGAGQ